MQDIESGNRSSGNVLPDDNTTETKKGCFNLYQLDIAIIVAFTIMFCIGFSTAIILVKMVLTGKLKIFHTI